MKKFILIVLSALLLINIATGCELSSKNSNEATYKKATRALKDNKAIVAYSLFSRLGDYKDSRQKAESLRYVLYYSPISQSGDMYVNNQGKVVFKNIIDQSMTDMLNGWSHINSLSIGSNLNVGLKDDGTLALYGQEGAGSNPAVTVPEMSKWTDIVQIAAGRDYIVGLKRDGTPLIEGNIGLYKDINSWTDVIQLSFLSTMAGLKRDGTVIFPEWEAKRMPDRYNLSDLIMISGNYGVKKDGSVIIITGSKSINIPNNWTDIVAVFTNMNYAVALNSDGILIDTNGNKYKKYKDIIYALPLIDNYIIGVRSNGSTCTYKSPSATAGPNGMIDFFKDKADIMLPTDPSDNTFASTADTSIRFDTGSFTYVTVKQYMDGKYKMVKKYYKTGDCGYLEDKFGLQDQFGNIIIKTDWINIQPLTDDRFICLSKNRMNVSDSKTIIVDRNETRISKTDFNSLNFVFKNEIIRTGIASNFPRNSGPQHYLVDFNGDKIVDTAYDNIEYIDNKSFKAKKDGIEYILDLDGKQIK